MKVQETSGFRFGGSTFLAWREILLDGCIIIAAGREVYRDLADCTVELALVPSRQMIITLLRLFRSIKLKEIRRMRIQWIYIKIS